MDPLLVKPRTRHTPTSARTREQLILAAERLFAEQGMDNVSLRQINAGAGQRNSSAAHYHFGSKDALIEAISVYRIGRIDRTRNAMLEKLKAENGSPDVAALLRALVIPLVQEIDDTEGGEYYILFVAQLLGHPTLDMRRMWCRQLDTSVGPIYHALRDSLSEIPDELYSSRFGLLWELTIHALADRSRIYGAGRPASGSPLKSLFIDNLMDVLLGLITAPISGATARQVEALRSGPAAPAATARQA